ncbi:fructokinase [Alkalibacterium putridalgicola]|jgi:fructokinase|uniref:Fructokinase n=1 Tax=Alkalibacterium putridalgicola TaxID=426703 RepID=A0A1H7TQ16_9LACT|nr:ROK family protein [Alkalibacterium putridalgicola]GEK88169.1 fructokinase [Alkalibacterium putridalgicola]SEL86763.1 fructokinase [Alkalibacterium putridalgicola]
MLGAIEAGGTKFVLAVSDNTLEHVEKLSIPTTTPEETFDKVFEFFDNYTLEAIGVGSFGPIDVNKNSSTYGYVTSTPKLAWQNVDFLGKLKERYAVPVAWTTDVNAAAYGELKKGAAVGKNSCLYLTVGTGIGGGAVINGEPLEGYGHPEMGHIPVRMHEEDSFKGTCPYHSNCLEGLAAGPAIEQRYNKKAQYLTDRKDVWDIEAYYLAQALMTYTLTLSPEKIILGGGVMKQSQLYPLIRKEFSKLVNGYVATPDLDEYIVSPGLDDNAGITGCLLLAQKEL